MTALLLLLLLLLLYMFNCRPRPTVPPPARTVLCFAGQPVLCRTACIVGAAGPPAVRAQPNGGEDDELEAISSAATILTVCCCGYQ